MSNHLQPADPDSVRPHRRAWIAAIAGLLLLTLSFPALAPAAAQEGGAVQEILGQAGTDDGDVYIMPDLRAGQTVYIYGGNVSGNLDPFLLIAHAEEDLDLIADTYDTELASALDSGRDPILALPDILGDLFLVWDDDGGSGYDAALAFEVPADGDYWLVLVAAPTSDSLGHYRLLLSLDTPEVLQGDAAPTGAEIAAPAVGRSMSVPAVQLVTGTLTIDRSRTFFELNKLEPGDTFYAYAEATSGNLAPTLILKDFGGKPLRTGNFNGQATKASLEFTAEEAKENFMIDVVACCQDNSTVGDFRLLVSRNAPEVLEGTAEIRGPAVLQAPTSVQVGLRMQQITGVDQQSENFGVVATLQMRWNDPLLAFSPADCACDLRTFNAASFAQYVSDRSSLWPDFTLFNQQGRRFTQNDNVVVFPNGDVIYLERFSATLQAPDFDFRNFPFDTQRFYIRLDAIYPEEFLLFQDLPGYSALGDQLGEEEWIIVDFTTEVSSETASTTAPVSRFSYGFSANRHLSFYIIRIFVPIFIIIMVSWITFFLKDYGKRVDVTAGNLLLFIAFNFTISGDLPRLGYLTFLDVILISTFAVTALVVAFNVILRRLELGGRAESAQRIDRYTLWIYPVAYIGAIVVVAFLFT